MSGKLFSPAMESIRFQTGALFFKDLTIAIEAIKKLSQDEIPDSPEVNTLTSLIEHHTNLKIDIDIGKNGPHVSVPAINKNHVLISDFARPNASSATGLALIKEAGNNLTKGGVSLLTGKVTGVFATIRHNMALPVKMFSGSKYSAEEIASVVGHEIGHLITYYDFIARATTTNQVLAGLSKELDGSGGVEHREAVLISVNKALRLGNDGVAELAKSTNKHVVEAVVISNVVRQSVSELGSNIYDMTSWEYLSDEYVARLGGGRYLVTALDKVYRDGWNASFRSTPAFLAFEALKLFIIIGNMFFMNFLPLVAALMVSAPGRDVYDSPEARLKRIRNQIIEGLKDKNLTPEDAAAMREDVDAVDVVISRVNDRRDVFTLLWTTLSTKHRKQWNQQELQKQLEEIAANDLFNKASKFKELSA